MRPASPPPTEVVGASARAQRDPGLAAIIAAALGRAEAVLSVGEEACRYEHQLAGLGSLRREISGRWTFAEARLPFGRRKFEAAVAISFEGPRLAPGLLEEMARVASTRVVVLALDPQGVGALWLARECFPSAVAVHREQLSSCEEIRGGAARGAQ